MSERMLRIGSETAYDALAESLDAVVRLFSSPCTLAEVAKAQGTDDLPALERKLDQLVQNGVLRRNGERYEAAGPLLYAGRQESVIGIITRLMLPSTFRAMQQDQGFAVQVELQVAEHEQRNLRQSFLAPLTEQLNELSDEPGDEKVICTLVAMGTSDVPGPGEFQERIIETVRRAGRQRSIPASADRAFLIQADGYFTPAAKERAEALVRTMAQDLKDTYPTRPEGGKPNYTVALGFSVRNGVGGTK